MDDAAWPADVSLADEDVKAFADITRRQRDLSAKRAAVQEFLKTVVQSGEARLTELQTAALQLQTDSQKLWMGLKPKYKLDLDVFNFELNEDGKSIRANMRRR